MIEEGLSLALRSAWPQIEVYPSQVPEGVEPPFAAYREVDRDEKTATFEIDACALGGLAVDGYRSSKQLAESIRLKLLEGFTFDGGCVLNARLTKRSDHVDQVEPMHWTRAQYSLEIDTDPY